MFTTRSHRLPSPRRRRARLALLPVLAGLAAGALPAAMGPTPAGAALPEILPKSEVHLTSWGGEDGHTPDCNSRNISGDGKFHVQWKVTSSIGSGSKVLPGTEWDLTAVLDGHTYYHHYNDGPDPLILEMIPSGPVARVARVAESKTSNLDSETSYHGDGWVGPDHGIGTWGYSYDSNSSPKLDGIVMEYSDGVDVTLKLRVKATEPGVIELPELRVSGWDSTPIADDVACSVDLDWKWTVLAPGTPVVKGEQVKTDASYTSPDTPDDRNGGGHAILIDVLANDDDPNTPGGVGDHDDVRLVQWSVGSAQGGSVDCGAPFDPPKDPAGFDALSVGPCRYDPPSDFSGTDSFTYTVRQGTDQAESQGTVTIKVRANRAPVAAPAGFAVAQNTDEVFSLADQITDADGDEVICMPALVAPPAPAIGTVTMHADCSFDWDNTDGLADGNVTFGYRVCDTHPLLGAGAHGTNATKAANYTSGIPADLGAATSRRCTDAEATIAVLEGLVIPPHAVKDIETVDAGYAGDGVGPYTVEIPVFANDFDPNGPKPTDVSILTGPDPSEGVAEVKGTTHVVFTPADGFSGPVSFTYRNCEDPAEQDPPYEGLGMCGVGTVQITVLPNEAPMTLDDETAIVPGDALVAYDVSSNDVEPDGEQLACTTTPVAVSDPTAVASLALGADCLLDLVPAAGAAGAIDVTYEVCDDHHLTSPVHPALPYGADGRFPNGLAPRCATAVVHVGLIATDGGPAEEPHGPQGDGPTDPDGAGADADGEGADRDGAGAAGDADGAGADAGGAGGDGGAVVSATGTLPATGSATGLLVAVGTALVLGGALLRRVSGRLRRCCPGRCGLGGAARVR